MKRTRIVPLGTVPVPPWRGTSFFERLVAIEAERRPQEEPEDK